MKRAVFLLLALTLLVTGCSSMLEREYSSSNRHVEYPVKDDTSILQAESYQGLVSALLYFVTEHAETGVVHLSNYLGDVEADLDAACAEVLEQDPWGAYALNGIDHQHARIVSYYEVSFTFDYAHTADEMAQIISASSVQAVPGILAEALARFDESCVLRLNYFPGDENSLLTLARQAWLDTPTAAFSRPEMRVTLYPGSGISRIVEFTFLWTEDKEDLTARSDEVKRTAQFLLQSLGAPPEGLTVENLLDALMEQMELDPEGSGTAYAALVEARANEQGVVSALHLLCQQAGLDTTVVEGRFDGEARFWLITATPDGYRHFDPNADELLFATDDDLAALGYEWSSDRYPACIDYAAAFPLQEDENEISSEN